MKVILIRSCALCLILAPLLAGAAEAAGNRDERYEAYRKIWDRARERIDIRELERLVEGLDRAGVARQRNLDALKERTNLTFAISPHATGMDSPRERAGFQHGRWKRYLADLEKAVEEEAPKLLQKTADPTWHETSKRLHALTFIARSAPHPAFLPLLRAIHANEQESIDVRVEALNTISRIPHEGVMEFLIDRLGAEERVIARRAWEQLFKLTDSGIQGDSDDWLSVQRKYETWWRRHKDDFEYDREALRFEY